MTLVYAANSDQDILLKEKFDAFKSEFPGRFEAVYAVSQPDEGSVAQKGRVTKTLLEEAMQTRRAGDEKVFICGPPAMEAALKGDKGNKGILEELGFSKSQVHSF